MFDRGDVVVFSRVLQWFAVLGYALMIAVFVLFSFYATVLASTVYFPLVLSLGIVGGICVAVPLCVNLIARTSLNFSAVCYSHISFSGTQLDIARREAEAAGRAWDANAWQAGKRRELQTREERRQWQALFLGLGVILLGGVLWGSFVAGVLTTNPLFFMVALGILCLFVIAETTMLCFFMIKEEHLTVKETVLVALLMSVVLNGWYVGLGLHLTGLLVLSPVWLSVCSIGSLCSLALSCCCVVTRPVSALLGDSWEKNMMNGIPDLCENFCAPASTVCVVLHSIFYAMSLEESDSPNDSEEEFEETEYTVS